MTGLRSLLRSSSLRALLRGAPAIASAGPNPGDSEMSDFAISGPTSIAEGSTGAATAASYMITRTGYVDGAGYVDWTVEGRGTDPAQPSDFVGGAYPSGRANFAAGVSSAAIAVNILPDVIYEPDRAFRVVLSNPVTIGTLSIANADTTIVNDDAPGLQPLAWSYNAGYAFETSPAGTTIGTPINRTAGSALTIVSVADSAGNPAASTLFAISGNALLTGATPLDYEMSAIYLVTVRETLDALTRDTVLPVTVIDLPEVAATFADDFTGTDNAPVRLRPGWEASAGSATYQDNIKIVGNRMQFGGSGTTVYTALHDVGAANVRVEYNLYTTLASTGRCMLRYTSGSNYFGLTCSGQNVQLTKRVAGTQAPPGASYSLYTAQTPNRTWNGEKITLELINNVVSLYVDDVYVGAMDVSDLPASNKAGFDTFNSTVAQADNVVMTPLMPFGLSNLQKVAYSDPATGNAYVPIVGSFVTAPTNLQWRLETEAGTVVTGYDWQDLNPRIANNAFSKFVTVPKPSSVVNYVIKVRDSANAGAVVQTAAFGVGLALALYGQSNMAHALDVYAPAADNYSGKSWTVGPSTTLRAPVGYAIAGYNNALADLFALPVITMDYAVGGQSVQALSPGAGTGYFEALVAGVRAQGGRVSAFLVDQGEANAGALSTGGSMTMAQWRDAWFVVYRALLAATGQREADVPFGIAITNGTTAAGIDGSITSEGHIQLRRAELLVGTGLASTFVSHHKFDCDYVDTIHQSDQAQYEKLGPRWAYGLAKKLGKVANDRRGPLITGMTRNGAELTFTVDLNGAVGIAADGGAMKGWQVVPAAGFDGSQDAAGYFTTPANTLTVNSVGVVGNTIKVTLSADPGGPVAARYPATKSGSPAKFDGASPFEIPYNTTGAAAPPQIRGSYADGSTVGLFPILGGLAA